MIQQKHHYRIKSKKLTNDDAFPEATKDVAHYNKFC